MKVQKADGSVELRQPGAPVPEAATWANPGIWIKRGWIQADDHATAVESGYARGKLKPMVPADPAAIARATSHVPIPGKPLPGMASPAADPALPTLDEDQDTISELKKMRREDLEKLAVEHEIADPASYPNKDELAKAILAKVKPESDALPATPGAPDALPDASPDAVAVDGGLLTELMALDRTELDELATEQGVKDATSLSHEEVAKALLEAVG